MKRMWRPIWTAFRDLFIPILPKGLVKVLLGNYDFAFLAHPLVLEDLARQYPLLQGANKEVLKFVSKHLWPVIGSSITGFRDKNGREVKGVVLFCPMSTRLFVLRHRDTVRKLVRLVRIAEKLQVKIIGLGAFVPIVTHDGKLLAKSTNLNMTTGTSFSAVIAYLNAKRLAEQCGLMHKDTIVAVVGAGGSVGSICCRLLMKNFHRFILIDKKRESLESVARGEYFKSIKEKEIFFSTHIDTVHHAKVVVVATNAPGVIVRSDHLRPGAVVVDAAQPRNVSARVPFERKDVIVVESGIASVEGLNTNFEFDLRSYNEVYSCLAEVLILMWLGIDGKQVGKFDLGYVEKLQQTASKVGIDIPRFRNRAGFVSQEDIDIVEKINNEPINSTEKNGMLNESSFFRKLQIQ